MDYICNLFQSLLNEWNNEQAQWGWVAIGAMIGLFIALLLSIGMRLLCRINQWNSRYFIALEKKVAFWLIITFAMVHFHQYHQEQLSVSYYSIEALYARLWHWGKIMLKISYLLATLWLLKQAIHLFFLQITLLVEAKYKSLGILEVMENIAQFLGMTITLLIAISFLFEADMKAWYKTFSLGTSLLTAAIAFASKELIANFLGAILILATKPFTLQDWIAVENITKGYVESISIRTTKIRNEKGAVQYIPNNFIFSKQIINYGKGWPKKIDFNVTAKQEATLNHYTAFLAALKQCADQQHWIISHAITADPKQKGEIAISWQVGIAAKETTDRLDKLTQLNKKVEQQAAEHNLALHWIT